MIPQAIVLDQQQVLLVKRDNPMLWELPGGSMWPCETHQETILREVLEETGIHVEIDVLLGWYNRTGFRPHVAPIYICHPTGGSLSTNSEDVILTRYFPLHSLPQSQFPWYNPILTTDLLSQEPRPLKRTQHLGIGIVLRCILLDIMARLGWIS